MKAFDAVVIGSGTAGQTAAHDLKQGGLSVAVVEQSDQPGGVCALHGCQPKKWFYEIVETIARCRHLEGRGVVNSPQGLWSAVLREKNTFTSRVPSRTIRGFQEADIVFLPGKARFISPEALRVGDLDIKAGFFVVATGAKPRHLPVDGSEHVIKSDDFLELESLPPRMIFVGGGFISFEFAHFAARLGPAGMKTYILQVSERPLRSFDEDMVELLVQASMDEGINILSGVRITSIQKEESGFRVATDSGETYEADLVVHGAGRVADLEGLNLEAAGVEFSSRGIEVDASMRTCNRKVFAVGDCAATLQLARVADEEGRTAAANILAELKGGRPATIDYSAVPVLLFTYPQYGMVGQTEKALQKEGIAYTKSFAQNLQWPTYRRVGMKHAAYKILAGDDGRLLGAHILSDNASGLIHVLKVAMINRITVAELYEQSIMSPYPSRESDLVYMLRPLLRS